MHKRLLGDSNLAIAPLAFGGNVLGWTVDEHTALELLDQFSAAGLNLIDTADIYSNFVPGIAAGTSEAIIGKWLKRRGRRDDVVIATKVGMDMGNGKSGLAAARIRAAVDESLQRLQTDYIDLYQAHQDDPTVPLQETLETFADLIRQGKVRAIGASNYSKQRLEEAIDISARLGLPRYASLQPRYNLYDRTEFEADLLPVVARHGLGVISYFGLARGFLTGKYRSTADFDKSPRGKSMSGFFNPRGMRILAALDRAALHHHATPAQIALAWVIAQPGVSAPIASATSAAQLEELIGATRLSLDASTLAELDESSRPG